MKMAHGFTSRLAGFVFVSVHYLGNCQLLTKKCKVATLEDDGFIDIDRIQIKTSLCKISHEGKQSNTGYRVLLGWTSLLK